MMNDQKKQVLSPRKPRTALSISWDVGKTAFKLISQYSTSADPKSYAVWYEYASRKNVELRSVMDEILQHGRGVTAAEIRQLYDTYVAESRNAERELDSISQAIQSEVAGAKSLVTEVISNSHNYVSSMDRAKGIIPNATTPDQIIEAIDELIEDTQSSQESAQNIQVALQSKHDQITDLSSKVGELRDNMKRDSLTDLFNQQKFEELLTERSAEALANGYSLTVLIVCVKNMQDLSLTAGTDISEFVLKTLSGFLTKIVGEKGVCARFMGDELAILLPKSAYADASKIAKQIIDELDHFKIVKKPSDDLVGYIECAFGGSSLQAGLSATDLIRLASQQASQAKFSHKSTVKFDLTNHQAA